MITSFVDESPTKKSLTVEIPVEEVRRVTDRTARTLAKQVKLPGFRPGKVPVELIKKRFADTLKGEVVDQLVQESVVTALKEKNLVPLGSPKVDDLKFDFEGPLSFKVDLEVRPPVAPKDYRGLKVPSGSAAPTGEEIEAVLSRLREGHAHYDPIEGRPAADGDFALVDIKGTFPAGDGKDFEAEKSLVEIAGDRTLPELSAHLQSALPGTNFSFQKDFPADAPDPAFAGKTVLYNVHLAALKSRVLPELDDDFARTVLTPRDGEPPEGAGLALLREKVAESLTKDKETALRETRRRALLDGLLALNDVAAPESMTEAEIDSALRDYARHLARQGVNLKEAQIDWNALRGDARDAAVRRVKEYLLLDAIGEAEGIGVTDTELDAELKRRATAAGMSFAELKAALAKAERLEGVREEIRIERVLDFLLAEAAVAG
ncbi:MAG TPA: trigger factor [Thermoanaerobaculia bacterium]|nr:trigger factor [Thermoanaerobaculia bacterium]